MSSLNALFMAAEQHRAWIAERRANLRDWEEWGLKNSRWEGCKMTTTATLEASAAEIWSGWIGEARVWEGKNPELRRV
jgi:hypothetical protein